MKVVESDLLNELAEAGSDAGADYNDGLDGWLGWEIEHLDHGPVLTVEFEPLIEPRGTVIEKVTKRWLLTPIEGL